MNPHVALILAGRKAAEGEPPSGSEDEESAGLNAASEALISAIHAKDMAGVADALRSAFTQLESEPHGEDEGETEGA